MKGENEGRKEGDKGRVEEWKERNFVRLLPFYL